MPAQTLLRLAIVAGALTLPTSLSAQACPLAPGCRQSVQQNLPFATTGQSLWGPDSDPTLVSGKTLTLFDQSWNQSGSNSNEPSVSVFGNTWTFGGAVSGSTSGRVGAFFDLNKVGTASVDVDYPVQVTVTLPEPNTFRPGDAVDIGTSWVPVSADAKMTAKVDGLDADLRGVFGTHNSASYDICLVDCSKGNAFFPETNISEFPFPIVHAGGGGTFGIGDQAPTDLASFADFVASHATGITAYVKDPQPVGPSKLQGTTLSAGGTDQWARFDVDIVAFLKFLGRFPGPPLNACPSSRSTTPSTCATGRWI